MTAKVSNRVWPCFPPHLRLSSLTKNHKLILEIKWQSESLLMWHVIGTDEEGMHQRNQHHRQRLPEVQSKVIDLHEWPAVWLTKWNSEVHNRIGSEDHTRSGRIRSSGDGRRLKGGHGKHGWVLPKNGGYDKIWTIFGQMSKFCPFFVKLLSKFCQCPIFVKII